jgi:hypothetical protein
MLVKRSIVERWYQTDSWVYKNFSYLFQNPLWQKTVPNGFSVCPYFWLNLFSLLLFRPLFVYPITYVFLPIIKFLGKPAAAVDKALYQLLKKVGLYKEDYAVGCGTGLSLVCLIGLACAGAILYFTGVGLKTFYPYLTEDSPTGMFSFWSVGSLLSLFGIIGLHKKITKTDCKTMSYLYVWFVLFAIAFAVFLPHEAMDGSSLILGKIWLTIRVVAALVWMAITFAAKWVWFGLTWAPISALYVPWFAYLLFVGLFGYLADRILHFLEGRELAALESRDAQTYFSRNREAWLTLFGRILTAHEYWKKGKIFDDDDDYTTYSALPHGYARIACVEYHHMIFLKALESYFSSNLDELQKKYPLVSREKLALISKIGDSDLRFASLSEAIGAPLPFSYFSFKKAVIEACKDADIKAMIDARASQLERLENDRVKKKEAKKTSWAHLTCLRITSGIYSIVCGVGRGFAWTGVQLWTLLAYLWMLVKAKKQGACPYFPFTGPTKKV